MSKNVLKQSDSYLSIIFGYSTHFYTNINRGKYMESPEENTFEELIFQPDGDPKMESRATMGWFKIKPFTFEK